MTEKHTEVESKMDRKVTERDLRAPEFRKGDPDDYEFREDGKIVRKDRWEVGVQSIRCLVENRLPDAREWEVADVVEAVKQMRVALDGWEESSEDHNLHHKSMSQPDGSEFYAIKIKSPKGVTFEQALERFAEHWLGMKKP